MGVALLFILILKVIGGKLQIKIMKELITLTEMNACYEARVWLETQSNWPTAWDKCERGDWMLWLLGTLSKEPTSKSRKQLVLIACECARLALKYVPKGESRPLKAIETAEQWARSESSVFLQDVRDVADVAAAAAAAAAAAYAAADVADAAAYAAAAADAAAAAAAYAAAAYAAADVAARLKILKKCADIVRKHYPKAPKI